MNFIKTFLVKQVTPVLTAIAETQEIAVTTLRAEAVATAQAEATVEAALVAELKKEIAELREAVNILHNELAKESAFTASEINHLHVSKRDGINVQAIRPFRQ